MNDITLPNKHKHKLANQEISEFSITWDNHLQQNGNHLTIGNKTIDGIFKLANGRTIHIHKDLD